MLYQGKISEHITLLPYTWINEVEPDTHTHTHMGTIHTQQAVSLTDQNKYHPVDGDHFKDIKEINTDQNA